MTTITKTAFTRALSLARAHGHLWASHVDHPAVASIVSGPGPYDAATLAEAFGWAASEDDSQFGGLGFALSHTTASGRLSWSVCAAGVSQGPYDTAPAAGDVDLTVSRPSLAWRVWAAQRDAATALVETEPMVGRELTRMLPPEPERGSVDVLSLRIPAGTTSSPTWRTEPLYDDVAPRHLSALAEAAYHLGGASMLSDVCDQMHEFASRMRSLDLMAAGIVMRQEVTPGWRVIELNLWGHVSLRVRLEDGRGYDDAAITAPVVSGWLQDFPDFLTTAPFTTKLVDRLMSWAGMSLERACQTAELALAEVGASAKVVGFEADGAWQLKVERIAEPAEDLPEGHFSSET
jgi:hypothetical protein